MKVLMFGRGAVAAIYGWALEQAGHHIEFYVRPGRAGLYGPIVQLDILDTRRRIWGERVRQSWAASYRERLEPDHDFDLIILSVPHHRLAEAVAFLAPRIGKATVLVFGNVWSEPLEAVAALPRGQVAWGFPGAGGAFDRHGALFGALAPWVTLGAIDRSPGERGQAVRQLFRSAGLRVKEQDDFRGWLWIHFIADAGILSQGLKAGSLANMVGATKEVREAMLTVRELLPLVEARGIDLRRHRGSTSLYRVPAWLSAKALSLATVYFPLARRSFQAHSDPEAEEPRAICRDALIEANRLGIRLPRLESALPYFRASS